METNREIKISLALSRRTAMLALVLLFLAWHPAFLGSETLNITTYYPAPYGGYVGIMTTDQTLLARDGGKVGVGLGNGGVPQYKLDLSGSMYVRGSEGASNYAAGSTLIYNTGGEGSTIRMVGSNNSRLYLENANGTFRIINDAWSRELMTVDQNGNTRIGGTFYGLCREVGYSVGSTTPCGTNERVMTWYGNAGSICGMMFYGGSLESAGSWSPYTCTGQDRSGVMLCCRIQP